MRSNGGAAQLTITIVCKCGEILEVPEIHAGKHVSCPACQRLTKVTGEKVRLLPPGEKNIEGLWREGDLLVVEQGAMLPSRCVKSNTSVNNSYLRCPLKWQEKKSNPGLEYLVGPFLYLTFFCPAAKKATVYIGLSPEWKFNRLIRTFVGLLVVLLGIGLIVVASMYGVNASNAFFFGGIISGIAAICFGLILTSRLRDMVVPERITNQLVFLRGVHPEYLATLSEFPAEKRCAT